MGRGKRGTKRRGIRLKGGPNFKPRFRLLCCANYYAIHLLTLRPRSLMTNACDIRLIIIIYSSTRQSLKLH